MHLVVYSDAQARGGAEMLMSRVLAHLPSSISVSVVGVNDEVTAWLASHRPDTTWLTLDPIENRTDLRGMSRHRATFARLKPDVLHFNLSSGSSCQWAMLAAATIPSVKRVALEHSSMGTWSRTSTWLKRLTSKTLSAHVAVGTATARILEDSIGLPSNSIDTLYHGVPMVGRAEVQRPDGPCLLTISRHDPVKGLDVLLDAMAFVDEDISLVIIGDGAERDALLAQRNRLGLEQRVEFRAPDWEGTPAPDQIWAFDGFVLPSRLEGFPVTIIEAQLAGVPVIATDVGSVRESIIDGETGWIVPPERPAAIAEAIHDLIRNPEDASRRAKLAQQRAQDEFTIDATVSRYVELYEDLLGHPVTT